MGDDGGGHVSLGNGVDSSPSEEAFTAGVPEVPRNGGYLPTLRRRHAGDRGEGRRRSDGDRYDQPRLGGKYDIAVLVSSDRDFVPVAEFLETRGLKVIHGAFPPKGALLTQRCWGHIDIPGLRPNFRL